MAEWILQLRGFGVAFGERIILDDVNLDVPPAGPLVLMGPAGTGKSTLLRSLAGLNTASPSFRCWGEIRFGSGARETPPLVAQKSRLLMASVRENLVSELPERHTLDLGQQRELAARLLARAGLDELRDRLDDNVVDFPLAIQRRLAIARTLAPNPRLLLVDEPTAGLDDTASEALLDQLAREAGQRAILVVLHNQRQARHLGGHTALLAGGRIQEIQATDTFFAAPRHAVTRHFVRSGSCGLPAPGTPPEHLEPEAAEHAASTPTPPPASAPQTSPGAEACPDRGDTSRTTAAPAAFGPRNFMWLQPGRLGGTPQPGLFVELEYDLEALRRIGIEVLVSLTEKPLDPDILARFGIEGIAFPIPDMGAPEPASAKTLCARIEQYLHEGRAVALHCKAGMGRTGTLLVAQLIYQGMDALKALEQARRIEPRWVQSQEQVEFLQAFERHLARAGQETESTLD